MARRVPGGDSHTEPSKPPRRPGDGGTPGRVQSSPAPPGPCKRPGSPAHPRSLWGRGPGREQGRGRSEKLLSQGDERQRSTPRMLTARLPAQPKEAQAGGRRAEAAGLPGLHRAHRPDRPVPHRPPGRFPRAPAEACLTPLMQTGMHARTDPERETHGHICGPCPRPRIAPRRCWGCSTRPARPAQPPGMETRLGRGSGSPPGARLHQPRGAGLGVTAHPPPRGPQLQPSRL